MAKKREYQIWNPGVNYYDSYLADLMTGTQNPEGTEAWKRERNLARKFASEKEDVALKGVLGGKRKLGKGERMPEGAYALANYPGLQSAIDWSMTGATPRTRETGVGL
jgi:hypothetical protein